MCKKFIAEVMFGQAKIKHLLGFFRLFLIFLLAPSAAKHLAPTSASLYVSLKVSQTFLECLCLSEREEGHLIYYARSELCENLIDNIRYVADRHSNSISRKAHSFLLYNEVKGLKT